MDIDALRSNLAGKHGRDYWRSLEELTESPQFQALLDDEFSHLRALWDRPLDRRSFLRVSAAAMAMAGVTACRRQPPETITPYVRMPEHMVVGQSRYYATTLCGAGPGVGVLVETREGRPLRIEGNPDHPASRGAVDVFNQAQVLSLYDPDRSQAVLRDGHVSSYAAFRAAWTARLGELRRRRGRGLALLTPQLHSPSANQAVAELRAALPEARWYVHDPVANPAIAEGAAMAFGRSVETHYALDGCARVLSLDADFLFAMPGALRYARDYAAARRNRRGPDDGTRLYVVESVTSVTGAKADHRQPVRAADVDRSARALARRLGLDVAGDGESPVPEPWLDALAADLRAHRGRCAVIPGEGQTAAVHALAHAINAQLGNRGRTALHHQPATDPPDAGLEELTAAMERGDVESLVMTDCNPAYNAPDALRFVDALARVPLRVHWGLYPDETAAHCHWHLPAAHELESWGDALAFDGTASPVQPLVLPLYNGVELLEFLPGLHAGRLDAPRERVRRYWRERLGARGAESGFDVYWQRSLARGVFEGSAAEPLDVALRPGLVRELPAAPEPPALELRFAPDPAVWDGRFANNAWLQELPKPLSKIVWGNALLLSPLKGAELGIEDREVVEIRSNGAWVGATAFWNPGQPRDSVTLHLGYGRERAGRVGDGVGVDAYRLRPQPHSWFAAAELRGTGRRGAVITTQQHHRLAGRGDKIAHELELRDLGREQPAIRDGTPEHSLYPGYRYEGYAWGMSIDIDACIGCNACIIACQGENNIPTVGPEQVELGREMHWLRVDRYYKGPVEAPEVLFQPVPCMHCEKAPCEYVCPVHATTHSSEGVNEMTYNRCIGTRFCSQNCPYKVRRFNFFDYTGAQATTPAARGTHNPEVTVRSRGVMEKCTYCIQRINRSRIEAQKDNRRIRDGELETACQQACPTRAIAFGDVNDPDSEVSRQKRSERSYAMLAELNTRPRTTYLAGVRNRNGTLEEGHGDG